MLIRVESRDSSNVAAQMVTIRFSVIWTTDIHNTTTMFN